MTEEGAPREWSWRSFLHLGGAMLTLVVSILLLDQVILPGLTGYFVQVTEIGNVLAGRAPDDRGSGFGSATWTWAITIVICAIAILRPFGRKEGTS